MHLFLTSSPCNNNVPDSCDLPCILCEANHFVDHLRRCYTPGSGAVLIAATPNAYALNDEMADTFARAFAWHHLPVGKMTLIDGRTAHLLPDALQHAGIVILGGGHVPTMHAFLEKLGLRALLQGYHGVVMGISAGTMNCAEEVYAQPEETGESIDPNYKRFFPGLGLTKVQVLPHYQMVKNNILDGKRLFEDITYADSVGHCFYALPDGSYILQENGQATIYGEAYRIAEGEISPVSGRLPTA